MEDGSRDEHLMISPNFMEEITSKKVLYRVTIPMIAFFSANCARSSSSSFMSAAMGTPKMDRDLREFVMMREQREQRMKIVTNSYFYIHSP